MKKRIFDYYKGTNRTIIELPHGGNLIPYEVRQYQSGNFTPGDYREDSDEGSDEFYQNLPADPHVLRFPYWRAFLDPNRSLEDFGKNHPDGVVKTHTSQGVQIYNSHWGIPAEKAKKIIKKYIFPYRKHFEDLLQEDSIERVIFGHTMPGMGTKMSNDHNRLRPLIMLGNGGDSQGNPGKSYYAPRQLLNELREIFEESYADLDVWFPYRDNVRFNNPYSGANSLNRFSEELISGKYPLTIEVNRDMWIHNPENLEPIRKVLNNFVKHINDWKSVSEI